MAKPGALALSVADKALDHLRTMYPDALKAVPASAATSLRNFTASAVQSAILSAVEEENEACALEALRWEDGIDAAEHIRRRNRKGA